MRNLFTLLILALGALSSFAQGTTVTTRYQTVAEMVAATIQNVPANSRLSALVTGRVTANDGGGGVFFFVPADVTATNLSTVFLSTGVAGRWFRQIGSQSDILWSGTVTNQKFGVNVPADLLTNTFEVRGGNIPVGTYAIATTGTLTNSASNQYGNYFQITGAGNESGAQYASRFELNSGYTGSGASYSLRAVNNTANAGVNLQAGNFALNGISHGPSADSGTPYNIGVHGQARWASKAVGVFGLGTWNNGVTYQTNNISVGVYGRANSHSTQPSIGGIFTVGDSEESFSTGAALIANSQAGTGYAVFIAQSGGTNVLHVANTGAITALAGLTMGGNLAVDGTGTHTFMPATQSQLAISLPAGALVLHSRDTDSASSSLNIKAQGSAGVVRVYTDAASDGTAGTEVATFSQSGGAGLLTATLDASVGRNLTIAGNGTFTVAGKGLQVKEGSNARMGATALVNGTVTVSNTSITANTRVFLTRQVAAGTTSGTPSLGTVVPATSFVINSLTDAAAVSADDDSTIAWLLVEPAP